MLYHGGGVHTVWRPLVRLVVLQQAQQRGNHERQDHCGDNEDREDTNRTSPALPQRLPVICVVVELRVIPHQGDSIDDALVQ